MSRPAVLDQRSVLRIRTPCTREHIYLRDLAKFLNCGVPRLRKWAKKTRLWHPGEVWREPEWVTPRGAAQIIAHIRAWQQQMYEAGLPTHEQQDHARRSRVRVRERRKALANSGAGTDAEPQLRDVGGAVGEAVAETPAVSDIRP